MAVVQATEFLEDIKGKLKGSYKFKRPRNVCIYKVPKYLKQLESAPEYVPRMVGLGPYHHNAEEVAAMGDHKLEAVRRMLKRVRDKHSIDEPTEFVIAEIRKLEEDISSCYEDADTLPSDKRSLACMFILDGCFILEICRNLIAATDENRAKPDSFEPIFNPDRLEFIQGFVILNDIMKLENQIPLIILERILELEEGSKDAAEEKLLQFLYEGLLKVCSPFDFGSEQSKEIKRKARHILEFLFLWITKTISDVSQRTEVGTIPETEKEKTHSIPPAAVLDDAGIKIEEGKRIQFRKGLVNATVYLPKLTLNRNKEVVLRNLIAFEECRAKKENLISRYAALMDDLVDSETDVALLREGGIIDNQLGSDEEVADLINSLCNGITRTSIPQIDQGVVLQVKRHYHSKIKVLLGEFIKEHFSKPWYVVIFAAAVLELGMTAVQTFA